ncbi:hypothetical protein HPB48_011361 [Haemaphysalis longicornis]|uniref:Secreted protein n=1 Tax=Haemaphysalis longicornis TaxID=44386 RepID=A0A9J6FY11_HAELO|nr:hypothetical protein HPB48_011361 [Haemaphysalis longicornis]
MFRFRFLFLDFVYPYMADVFAFVAKAPMRIPLTQAILYPFQLKVIIGQNMKVDGGRLCGRSGYSMFGRLFSLRVLQIFLFTINSSKIVTQTVGIIPEGSL